MEKKKIIFLITSLDIGGAESMLLRLLKNFDRSLYNLQVITLKSGGSLEGEVKALGIPLQSMEMETTWKSIGGIFRLQHILVANRPDFIFCWMYHANLIGGLAAKSTNIKTLWSIRHNSLDPKLLKERTIIIARLGAYFSKWLPNKIVFCSESSMREHLKIGYDPKKSCVIPNGFDINIFKPNKREFQLIRRVLDIPSNALVVGHVGRFDPTKDHHGMVKAAGIIAKNVNTVYFIFCGHGINKNNKDLISWLEEAGIEKHTRLLDEQNDMDRVFATMDVFVSSSVSEAFPNVVGEAMSCGIPCVVTDVGDSAIIVGETGLVVPPFNPKALADASIRLLKDKETRMKLGNKARLRIINNYSLDQVIKAYERLFIETLP